MNTEETVLTSVTGDAGQNGVDQPTVSSKAKKNKKDKKKNAASGGDGAGDVVVSSASTSTSTLNGEEAGSGDAQTEMLASMAESLDTKPGASASNSGVIHLDELRKAMMLMNAQQKPARTVEEATSRSFRFWSTQPVPKMDEVITKNEVIEPDVPTEMIRQEPYSLPTGFIWDTLDIENAAVLRELYTLLSENYVEDDDCLFRFDYQADFLKWALKPTGWKQEWHCGVRAIKSKKLLGFISAIPATICVHEENLKLVEINFLCVHKKLRSKRVAPVLIREITRRVNSHGIFQAVYTAGVVLPKPISTCRYWHRSLNPKKLLETRFSHLTRNMTLQRTIKLFRLPTETKCEHLRSLTKADVPQARVLLSNYLKKFKLCPVFNDEEFEHWFMPRKGIIDTYVVDRDGVITDMISYYTLPSTVVNNPLHKTIKAAYAFYNVATSMTLQELMQDALILAKNDGFDVFNALDLMDNKQFLENLKFGIGDGNLQYYLYNWRCPSVSPNEIALVLQ